LRGVHFSLMEELALLPIMETKMKSRRGVAPGGEDMDPGELPEEPEESRSEPRAVPAPGLPISQAEYDRMKEAAKHAPAPRVKEAQEDHQQKEK
jgi:hypothetical protein